MTEYTDLTDFSSEGLNIGKDQKVMAYLHGLSDFWVYMFDDASKINTLMEANSVVASDIYNKLLQLTSGISLEDISVLTNSQIKLILISDEENPVSLDNTATPTSGKVNGRVETYYIPNDTKLKYAKSLANRAFLPTSLLENESDFYIDPALGHISFAKRIADCGFPFRVLPSGAKQYAIWAIDAKVDDGMIYTYYAKLIGINPTTSTEMFKSFVYGMYYLFVNGPNADTLRKGLNLSLGIPLARDTETVLEIQKYLNTDQYIVVSDLNSYVIPYGLEPTVSVGDVLNTGDEISTWVEVKDYVKDGDWWINFMIPAKLMPSMPADIPGIGGADPVNAESIPNRYATSGSYADWLMRNYLKKHTFLVNIKTLSFKNIQAFEQLSNIINEVKPAHTTPIYVWTIPVGDDPLILSDTMALQHQRHDCEVITDGMYRFTRDSTFPLSRGCPQFIRMSGPGRLDQFIGRDLNINGSPRSYNGGVVTGYNSPQETYSVMAGRDKEWCETFRTRAQDQFVNTRGKIGFKRGFTSKTTLPFKSLFRGVRLVYLYTTTERDISEKFASVNTDVPEGYIFSLFKPTYTSDAINQHSVNDSFENNFKEFLAVNYAYFFTPGTYSRFLGPFFPKDSSYSFCPAVSDLKPGDYLVFTRIGDGGVGVYWATSNYTADTTPYLSHTVTDPLSMTISGKVTRGMAPHGNPMYMLRGGATISYNSGNAINDKALNDAFDPSTGIQVTYSDSRNPSFIRDRSGTSLVTVKTWN